MGYKRKGQLTPSIEYDKHFRAFGKKYFWKGERQAEKTVIKEQLIEWDEKFQRESA